MRINTCKLLINPFKVIPATSSSLDLCGVLYLIHIKPKFELASTCTICLRQQYGNWLKNTKHPLDTKSYLLSNFLALPKSKFKLLYCFAREE